MKELKVYFTDKNKIILVGILAKKNGDIFFQYEPEFLSTKIELSPYTLPLSNKLFQHKNHGFSDIFGLFADSLPDGWGLLLQDRYLRKQGKIPNILTSFDRLMYIGESAPGALSFKPSEQFFKSNNDDINLHEIGKNAVQIYNGEEKEILTELIVAGGSPAGARPKILLTEKANGQLSSDIINLNKDDRHWLVKFDISNEFTNFSKIEFFYSLLAKESGLEIPKTKLFTDSYQNQYFGIERFDRKGSAKFHIHSFGSLIESNFRIPANDYDDLFKVTTDLTKDINELKKVFKLMVFNVLSHNRDDHVKNFSFILDHDTYRWKFAPCYDLTPSYGPGGEHSLTVLGEGKIILDTHFYKLGEKHQLSKQFISETITSIKECLSTFEQKAGNIGIEKKDIQSLRRYIKT